MKTKTRQLILAVLFSATIASEGATIFIAVLGSPDDTSLDSATETYTENVTGFNGTDASFDLVITATASCGERNTAPYSEFNPSVKKPCYEPQRGFSCTLKNEDRFLSLSVL